MPLPTIANHVNAVQMDHPLGRKVAVMGHGGKTTLARAVARKYSLEHIELDQIANLPGWKKRPTEEFRGIVSELMTVNPNGWVTDHWHSDVVDMIHERADSLIVLQLPFPIMLWRRTKRSLMNALTRKEVCGGNVETLHQHLFTRNSAILEMWQKRARYNRLADTTSMAARDGIDFYVIHTIKELDRFYELHGLVRDG